MTDEEGKELLHQNRLLMEKLAKASEKKKDFWDKLSSLLTALIGPLVPLVIGVVGIHFTTAYNRQQLRYTAAGTVVPFMPYVTGKDPVAKGYAIRVIHHFDTDLAVELSTYQTEEDKKAIARPAEALAQPLATGTREHILSNGDFAVHAGEIVTVMVTAQGTTPLANWSDLQNGVWLLASPLERSFKVANNPIYSFDAVFQFTEKAGGKYHIIIKWGNGDTFEEDYLQSDTPSMLPIVRSFLFVRVGQ